MSPLSQVGHSRMELNRFLLACGRQDFASTTAAVARPVVLGLRAAVLTLARPVPDLAPARITVGSTTRDGGRRTPGVCRQEAVDRGPDRGARFSSSCVPPPRAVADSRFRASFPHIQVLKSLPPIECFVVLMPTFRNGEELPATEQETATLPTQEELDEMWAEQDRIEEEADRFDGGDLTRLRKMAKGESTPSAPHALTRSSPNRRPYRSAASQKSLSVSDTDLLSITLSTLYLLDTLLHLLRARAETLDLLALRLQWDAMRFAVGRETEAIEKDVRAFVEGKGQWGVEKYEKGGSVGGMGSPLLGASARDGGGQGRRDSSDSGSIRSVGGSSKVATKSQRYRE